VVGADFTYTWTLAEYIYTAFCVDVYFRRDPGLAGDVDQGHPAGDQRLRSSRVHPMSG
jgi:hypothetical protein